MTESMTNIEALQREQDLIKISRSEISNEDLLKMVIPYLERRKMVAQICDKYSSQEREPIYKNAKDVYDYCNHYIKLILMLN